MKKAAVILILFFVISIFGACGENNNTLIPSNTDIDSVILSELEAKYIGCETPIELAVNGAANYVVIRGKECSPVDTSAAAYVMKQLKTTFGTSFQSLQDDKDEVVNEILIGDTNRKESGYARELVIAKGGRSNDYIICVIDTKICIYGMTDEATKAAAEYFVANYATQSSVDQKLCYYNVASDSDYKKITLGATSKLLDYNIVRARYNVSYMEQQGMENLSAAILEATGYQVDIVKDKETEAQDFEIIVGETARDGEEVITDYDTYVINPVGNKIYVNGGNTYSTAIALEELTKLVKNGAGLTEKITGSYKDTVKNYGEDFHKIAWEEEFNGTALDTKMWIVTDVNSKPQRALLRHDGMYSYRSAANVYVEDGCLVEKATYDDRAYYGAYIINNGNMAFKRGYTETSLKIPFGVGIWTSFWLTPDEIVGIKGYFTNEVNMTECTGYNHTAYNLHRHSSPEAEEIGFTHTSMDNGYSAAKVCRLPEDEYFYQEFHTFGYFWLADRVFFTMDGEVKFEYTFGQQHVYSGVKSNRTALENDIDAFDDEMLAFRITMAVGFKQDPIKGASYWTESNKFVVDYCHIYQAKDGELLFY